MDRCDEVFINVNVHFIVDPTTGRTTAKPGENTHLPEEAFLVAKNMLTYANIYNVNISDNAPVNQAFWGAPVTTPQCVPVRYLLNGVFFHYLGTPEASDQSIRNSSLYEDAINVVVKNTPSDGFAILGGEFCVVGNFKSQNLVHEIGHCCSLRHPHDNCLDTWYRPKIDWDGNGDGVRDEFDNRCWDNTPVGPLSPNLGPGAPTYDLRAVGQNGLIIENPCCDDNYQNNNVMTHSGYAERQDTAAMTPCQVERMLNDIFNAKCDLVEDVNPICAPTSAFIGVLPDVNFNSDCTYTFYLGASVNELEYKVYLEVLNTAGSYSMFYEGDWETGSADQFTVAVGTDMNNEAAELVILSGHDYRITLETRNACDTDVYTYEFSTNEGCDIHIGITDPIAGPIVVYPNPFWDGTTVSYSLSSGGDIEIYTAGVGADGTVQAPIYKPNASGAKQAGIHQVHFENYEMVQGINYVIIVAGGHTHLRTVVKQ